MSPNIALDFQVMDALETITFLSKTADGTFATGVTIANCLRRAQHRIVDMGGDRIETADMTWHIWTANIPSGTAAPKYGDNIKDANNVVWIVLQVEYASWISRYRCTCKRLGLGVG